MVVGLAGEKLEREAGFRARSMARFVRRSEGDDRIKPLTLQRFAVELGFAAGRREVALGEGKKGIGGGIMNHVGTDALVRPAERGSARVFLALEIQPDKMIAFQSLT